MDSCRIKVELVSDWCRTVVELACRVEIRVGLMSHSRPFRVNQRRVRRIAEEQVPK